jgi:hypothetical protein
MRRRSLVWTFSAARLEEAKDAAKSNEAISRLIFFTRAILERKVSLMKSSYTPPLFAKGETTFFRRMVKASL